MKYYWFTLFNVCMYTYEKYVCVCMIFRLRTAAVYVTFGVDGNDGDEPMDLNSDRFEDAE